MGLHRRDDVCHQPIGHFQGMEMFGRSQRLMVQGEVGVCEPQHAQAVIRRRDDPGAEAPCHLDVAREIVRHIEMGISRKRRTTGAERTGAMQHGSEVIRIEEVGSPRRDVRIGDLAARPRQPLGHGGHTQSPPRDPPHGLAERRRADIVHDEAALLDERHLVALQPMTPGKAPGRDRGRGDARHRGEHRPVVARVAMLGA